MKKIIGIITGWGCQDWIEPAIQQGLEYTDELHVCISCHSQKLLEFEDNTLKIAKQYESEINLFDFPVGDFHSTTKAQVLNKALNQSKYREEGNWIWILDVDEFYKRDSFEYIKKIISADICDMIQFRARFFYINLQHYLISEHNRLFKIKGVDCRFFPTQQYPYVTKMVTVPLELGMYHYSTMGNPYMKWKFWENEYPYEQNKKIQWLDKIYRNYDLYREYEYLEWNRLLNDNYGPWITNDFKPQKDGRLYEYRGSHPERIPDRLINIKDYRKFWKF